MTNVFVLDGDSTGHQVVAHFRICQIFVRSLASQHLEEDDADAPNIAFGTVYVLPVALGTHVCRRSNIIEQLRFLCLVRKFAETEVCDPCAGGCEKNVGSF